MRQLSIIHGPVAGGGIVSMIRLSGPLRRHGWETIFLGPAEPGNAVPRVREAGLETHTMELHRLRRTPDPRIQARFAARLGPEVATIRRLIRERDVDVVKVYGPTNPHGAIAAHLEGRAVVWEIYDTVAPMWLRRLTMPLVIRLADAVTTWGVELGREHPGTERLDGRWIPVFPPVDATRFRPDEQRRQEARAELGVPESAVLVGSVGNLNPTKGHEWLMRAVARLRGEGKDVWLRVLGASGAAHAAYEGTVRDEADRLGLTAHDRLRILDPGSRVADLMPAFDVFALASVPASEGMPTVICEAMACGLPVVATGVGAVAEQIDEGVTGHIVPPESVDALAGALGPLVDDADLRRRLGAAGRRRALEHFALERCAERHLLAYERALEHRRGR